MTLSTTFVRHVPRMQMPDSENVSLAHCLSLTECKV